MALFAIPNPKKSIQVDFPVETVRLAVKNINLINDKYKFHSSNEIFNQYTYEALEFLSLGVFIDINLNSISDTKTEIVVEVRRKIGSFNQSHEVTKANEHLVKIFDAIAKLTGKTVEEIDALRHSRYVSSQGKKQSISKHSQIPAKQAWYEKTGLVVLLCILFFPVGLYGLWKNSSIAKGWKIAATILIALVVIANLGGDQKVSANTGAETQNTSESTTSAETSNRVNIGQPLQTDYFEITVNKAELQNSIDTGNEFSDLQPETDITYLVINATFKNTDNESRMIMDGSVWINYNGKDYEFDKSETIMAEGWGLMLEQINPLTSKTTNLVFKIPSEIKGEARWQPGRADDDEVIYLGQL